MKKMIRLANKFQIKHAQEMNEDIEDTLRNPVLDENTKFPAPPLVPKELQKEVEKHMETKRPPTRQTQHTLPSSQMEEPIESIDKKHINVIKDLANKLRSGSDKFVALNPEQINAIVWVSTMI